MDEKIMADQQRFAIIFFDGFIRKKDFTYGPLRNSMYI